MARILIVDDSEMMRRKLRHTLESFGHEVVGEARTGRQAIKEHANLRPDIVTMDISMPDGDGIFAVKRIVSDFEDAYIIMVTALSQKSMVYEAIKSGARNYLVKPIQAEKVKEVIDIALKDKSKCPVVPPSKPEPPVHTIKAFEVNNLDAGRFIIKISDGITEAEADHLTGVLNSFSFIPSVNVAIHFNDPCKIDQSIFNKIASAVKSINRSNGTAYINCNEQNGEIQSLLDMHGLKMK